MHLRQDLPRPFQKARRYRRFELQFPVCVRFPSGGGLCELDAVSKNVSVGGLLIRTDDHIPPRTPVSLTMEVRGSGSAGSGFSGSRSGRSIRLRGEGRVVRVEALAPGAGFEIAVECTRTITQMDENLPAAS